MSDSDDEEMFGFSDMEIPERKNLANVCLDLHEEAEGEESDPNEEGEVVTLEEESMKTVKSQKVKKHRKIAKGCPEKSHQLWRCQVVFTKFFLVLSQFEFLSCQIWFLSFVTI